MITLDLNSDLGEGAGDDAGLMPLITSANIACGGHAGDASSMRAAAALARRHGVAIGAHPGFEDREHFGRRDLALAPADVQRLVERQVAALAAIAPVRHVKPHGALYNRAAVDEAVARPIVAAVRNAGPEMILFAPAGSVLARIAAEQQVRVAQEVFADRTYRRDGTLTPRSEPDATIGDEGAMLAQVLRMVQGGTVIATDGTEIPIVADTLCVHGDGPHAVAFARRIRAELAQAGVTVRAVFGAG